jgi:hypothetical protein
MIYKFYWFLPELEDIYQDLSETPNWPGSLKRKRHFRSDAGIGPGITNMFTRDSQSNIQMEEGINAE